MRALHLEQRVDVFHREHGLGNRNIHERSKLLPGILLFDGVTDDAFLHIVAHHGGGELHPGEIPEIAVDELDGLVQIQPYGREVAVPGQGKPGGTGRNAAFGFRFHGSFKKVVRGRRPGAEIRMFWERYPEAYPCRGQQRS